LDHDASIPSDPLVPLLDALISSGARINATNKRRGAPLQVAARRGHVDAVRFLLSKGANPAFTTQRFPLGWDNLANEWLWPKDASPIGLARQFRHQSVIELLEAHAAIGDGVPEGIVTES
jgi:ankyrin repeat protein